MSENADRARADLRDHPLGAIAWIAILAITGVVQLLRQQLGDALIFGIASLLLLLVAAGALPMLERLRRPAVAVTAMGAAAVAIAVAVVPRHSVLAGVTFFVIIGLALVAAAPTADPRPRTRWPKALRRLVWAWVVIWIVACLWELLQVLLGGIAPGGRAAHPALSDLLDPLLAQPPGRIAFAVCWTAIGVFLVTRGGRR